MLGLSLGTIVDSRHHPRGGRRPRPAFAAPALVAAPRLVGTGRIGEAVTVDPGAWSGQPAPQLARQWARDGGPIPGAVDISYVPVASDDRTGLTCTVSAVNVAGAASAGTSSLFITHVPPGALGLPDVNYAPNSGVQALNALTGFTGAALRFGVTGDGVSIDPETGQLSILTDALRDGIEVLVTATNSGGGATGSFRLTVSVAPGGTSVAPSVVVPPTVSGPGEIGAVLSVDPGVWSGTPAPDLALQWRRDGAAIPAATGATYVPVAADDLAALSCAVLGSNIAGSLEAVTDPVSVTYAAPVALGGLGDLVLDLGSAAAVVAAAADFTGAALTFSVAGAAAGIDAATGVLTVPTEALRTQETVTVTATNSGGSATSAFRVTVAPVAPVVPALVTAPVLSGTGKIGAVLSVDPGVWSGAPAPDLALQWRRAGAAIPGATGATYVPVAADDRAVLSCAVTASNAGGSREAVTAAIVVTQVAPVAADGLDDLVFDLGSGVHDVPMAGRFTGAGLTFAATGAGASIDAATGVLHLTTGAAVAEGLVTVTATNSGGSADRAVRVSVGVPLAAPKASNPIGDLVYEQGSGAQTVSTQGALSGQNLVFTLDAAPAGVVIDAGSGLVTVPTTALLTQAVITVRASNAAGSAVQSFRVTVRSTVTVFDAAAKLGDLVFLSDLPGLAWSYDAGGFGRLVPALGGWAHGNWAKAAGDGGYRCLARWSGASTPQTVDRPFVLSGRVRLESGNLFGIRLDAFEKSYGERLLQLRQYTGVADTSKLLASVVVGWAWDTWTWVELLVEGTSVKARLYPEAAAAPAWQIDVITNQTAPGAFGPGGVSSQGKSPAVDIKRLEYQPLANQIPVTPSVPLDSDWTLAQFTERT